MSWNKWGVIEAVWTVGSILSDTLHRFLNTLMKRGRFDLFAWSSECFLGNESILTIPNHNFLRRGVDIWPLLYFQKLYILSPLFCYCLEWKKYMYLNYWCQIPLTSDVFHPGWGFLVTFKLLPLESSRTLSQVIFSKWRGMQHIKIIYRMAFRSSI